MLGLIVQSLQNRWVRGIAPFTVLSCDNLPSNGKRAKAAVIAYAQQLDPEFATWIDSHVRFPCTMVDRITPATTDTDRMQVAAAIGMIDAWPVVAEPFTQWIIEDDFSMGRPDWTLGGAIFSNDIEHWECMKLQCLNGAHSTLAYLGQLAGCETVAQAMDVPFIAETLDTLWGEVSAVIQPPDGVDLAQYVDSLRQRFRNPAIRHRTAQIAMDGSQKLPQRLLTPLRARIQRGLPSPAIATAVAAWMHFAVRTARTPGQALDDPLSAEILARARAACTTSAIVNSLLSLQKVFANDLPMAGNFRTELLTAFSAIAANPALATFDKTNTSG
jgi:fructuronate reductase